MEMEIDTSKQTSPYNGQQAQSSPYQYSSQPSTPSPYIASPYNAGTNGSSQQSNTPVSPYVQSTSYAQNNPSQEFTSPEFKNPSLRRRNAPKTPTSGVSFSFDADHVKKNTLQRKVVRNLDMFPKVERDLTVTTERGGLISLIGYGVMMILVVAEITTWLYQNGSTTEHLIVDTSMGRKMRVNINITFPALACVDLHVDAMDVAGDSQIDIIDTLVKRRLHLDGSSMGAEEIKASANVAKAKDDEKKLLAAEKLDPNYCGPCYGAQEKEGDCCNTCDDLKAAYELKRWGTENLMKVAEQCIREGKNKVDIKRMTHGEGCNLDGYMLVNRVAGNFHIAMGEGIERDGRHIHQFIPEDAPNFNASHYVHDFSFGPKIPGVHERGGLDGVRKVTTAENGETGLFQYFVKVVPTTYKESAEKVLETNRFYFTERFRPLMTELEEEHRALGGEEEHIAGVAAGGKTGSHHDQHEHHKVQNAVLPGVFFVYEIYPFAVEINKVKVPLTHLLIRLMAVVGGVITITGWVDSAIYAKEKKGAKSRMGRK